MRVWRLFVMGLLLSAMVTSVSTNDVLTMRIAYSPTPFNLPTIVLRRQGYLEKELTPLGWKVKWIAEPPTAALVAKALAAGALDMAIVDDTSLVYVKAAGNEIAVLAPYSIAPGAFAVVVPIKGEVQNIKALAGKRAGLPIDTTAYYLLARTLEAEGLSLGKVEVVDMTPDEAAAALAGKRLDAAVLAEPILSREVAAGKVRVLKDGTGQIGGLTIAVARPRFLENEEAMDHYKEAVEAALKFIADNPAGAMKLASQETHLSLDLVRKIAAKYTFTGLSRAEMLLDLTKTADFLADRGLIARRMTLKELVGCACE